MRTAMVLMLALLLVSGAEADSWITTTYHPGDVPLGRPNANGFYDGNKLWEACSAGPSNDVAASLFCIAYVAGAVDLLHQYNNNICVPTGVSQVQAADVVAKYLREHPELRHLLAGALVGAALAAAFPCVR